MYTTPLGTDSSSLCLNHQIYADGTAFPVLSCICFPPQYHSQNAHQQGIWPFLPLHFRSGERKVHRENFRSCGTFVPWNIRSRGAKSSRTSIPWNFRSLWNFRSSGVNVPRTFVPWNFRTVGTFAPQTTFVPFNFRSCGLLAVITATRACGSLVKQR